jgi:hypothetical protein
LSPSFFTNTTELALQEAAHPFLSDALLQILGITVLGGDKERLRHSPIVPSTGRSVQLLFQFLAKFSRIYSLPISTAIPFFQELIFLLLVFWFGLNLLSLFLWILSPDPLKKKLSVPL